MVNDDHIKLSQKYQRCSCVWVGNIVKCSFRGHPNLKSYCCNNDFLAISNVFWIHNFNLIFTDSGEQTAKVLEKIGTMLLLTDRNSTDGDIDLNELQDSSNRRQRVTKQVQLSRMLECIHGMTPNYAQKLASEFGTFKTMKRRIKNCENFDNLPINFLPNHLKKSLKLFFV